MKSLKLKQEESFRRIKKDTLDGNDNALPAEDREKLESIADTLGIDYTHKNNDELRNAIELELEKGKRREEV